MTGTLTPILTITTRFAVVAALMGSIMLRFAGVALADSGTIDQPVGGDQCGGQPSRCAGVSVPFNLPQQADAVEVTFTKNNNPCADLNVQLNADGVTQIPLGTVVPLAPGNHTLNVTPTCSTDLSSWGGTVHLSKVHTTGNPANPPAATPTNAIAVTITQTPTKVTVSVQNTSQTPNDCSYDAHPKSPLLPPVHRDFHLNDAGVQGSDVNLDFPSPPLGATYHVVVSCKAEPQETEDGHFEQDVTGSL